MAKKKAVKKKTTTKKTVKKKAVRKKATTKKKTTNAKVQVGNTTLTTNQVKILNAFKSKPDAELSIADLKKKTGVAKGYSAALGASTTEKPPKENTLIGLGLVTANKYEGKRQLHYKLSKKGKSVLNNLSK